MRLWETITKWESMDYPIASKPLKKRNLGLDLLKAILAFLIVIRHSAVISIVPLESAGGVLLHRL